MGINRAPRVSMTVSAVVLCNVMGNGAQAWGADVTAAAADLARGETKDVTSDGDARLGEVIVTSERRETRLQDTPAAIAVMGGEELQQQHVTTVLDVPGMIPNVQVGTNEAQAQITIRGISFTSLLDGDEPRVAYYVNGVYVPRATDQLGTFFDVDRIEVLRGPQGTLYGRNATGGAFSIITNQPTRDLSGYMNFTGGNYGTVQTDGALSGALSDTLTARIAFQTISHNGYGRNLETGTDINDANKQSVRATFRWQPSDAWDITATADYHQESDHNYAALSFGPTYIPLLAPTLSFSQDITAARDPKNKRNNEGLGITSIYHLSDAIDIKSILGYRHSSTDFHSEGEQSAEPLSYNDLRETDDSASAELQMIGNARQWHWVAGLYYFHDRDVPDQDTAIDAATIFGPPSQQVQGFWQNAVLGTNAGAAYADITYDILPSLSLTAGGRYSVEHKTNYALAATSLTTPYPADNAIHNGFLDYLQPLNEGYPEDQAVTFHSFTPKAGLQYRFTDDLNVWFTYSRGFKSGGYAYYFLQPAYNPEKLTDYEGGVKSTWLDRRLTANLTVFHYDFTNMQQQVVGTGENLGVFVLNATSATINGAELEIVAKPTPQLQLEASFGKLESRFGHYLTGDNNRPGTPVVDIYDNRVPNAPSFTANVSAQYTWALGSLLPTQSNLTLRGEYLRLGKTYFDFFNHPMNAQDSYGIGNVFLTVDGSDSHWSGGLFVRNIADEFAITGAAIQGDIFGGGVTGSATPPRTFGITVGYKW